MKINYVALLIFLSIIGGVIYVVYDVRHRGANELGELYLSASNKLVILYILIVIIGSAGISLVSTYTGKLQNDMENRLLFQTAEAVFLYTITDTNKDSDGNNTTSYEHIYEYYVDGKRYECKYDVFFATSKAPKKITVRYNPEKPQEVVMTKENILGLIAGILCIGITILLFYGSTKIEFEGGKSVYDYLKNMIWK